MNNYYMGIDNGGTVTKAVIFDDCGQAISSASATARMITPQAGFTERDMDELWDINCQVIRQAIEHANINSSEISGIACTGHGKGLYLWGKNGKPCYHGIVSTDNRAWFYPEKWSQDGTAERVFLKTYQKILACQPVSLLCWLMDNKPEVLDNVQWIFEVKDYIRFRLTGLAFAEITDYSGSNLLNVKDKCFDRTLLAEYGLERFIDNLPPLRLSTDYCGSISYKISQQTGLAVGTAVAGGMFDIDACAIAMNITSEKNVAVIAGTWSINEYIARQPVLNHSIMMNSLYCLPGFYLVEECSATSAGNLAWYVDMFMKEEKKIADDTGQNIYQYCDELAASISHDEQNIIFLPYIYGSNNNPQAKACLIGLDSHHNRAQIVRAVMEGIAFCHKQHLDRLLSNRKPPNVVRLAGGAAKSQLWAQIFSDIFELPVEIVDAHELGTLGCAMAAAVASGHCRDLQEAAHKMTRVKFRLDPNPDHAPAYRHKYTLYTHAATALDDLWKDMS